MSREKAFEMLLSDWKSDPRSFFNGLLDVGPNPPDSIASEFNIMKFVVTIDRDEHGVWIVECPSIPGCVSQGATREESLANIREAITLCLEVRAERGMPLTLETQLVEVFS
ncbi:MAG: type II toxin-antitoxin system HicB family antitoxin [Planctomycetaceae bacterium]